MQLKFIFAYIYFMSYSSLQKCAIVRFFASLVKSKDKVSSVVMAYLERRLLTCGYTSGNTVWIQHLYFDTNNA